DDVLIRGRCVIDATPPKHDDERMARRTVCIVAFDGMQQLDAIGPFEVFAGATKVLAAHRRPAAGYEVSLVSDQAATVTTESGLQIVTAPPSLRAPQCGT